MSGALHVLFVAADAQRTRMAQALYRPRSRRDGESERILAERKRILLRRRYVQHPESPHHRTLRKVEAAEHHLVLHITRDHGLRNIESHEGSRMSADDRWL